jgi:hypothetical protein
MVGLGLKGRCNVAPFFLFLGLEFLPGVLPDITITQMVGVKKDEMMAYTALSRMEFLK